MESQQNTREQRAKEILDNPNCHIISLDEHHYQIKSLTSNRIYDVVSTESGWICSCPDSTFRKVVCKHSLAISLSVQLKQEARQRNKTVIEELTINQCPQCHSDDIVRHGIRHNKNYDLQRFSCRNCKKRFSFNLGFERMSVNPKVITSAMQLYFTGESLRGVQKFITLQGVNVAHSTVYKWIKKYTTLMEDYLSNITPNVSDTWRADEVWTKVKGDKKYLFALMDDETRFLIAKEISDRKEGHDASGLFRQAKEVTGKRPKVMITDGLQSYNEAYKKEFWTNDKKRTVHVRHIHLQKDMNNNKMERWNGSFRDREKVVRGLKKDDSPLINGYMIYHNYVRPHMGLDNHTPAEKCGIEVKGNDKWKTLIQNSVRTK
ncbi:DDE-type integrase/transposase/recombinase [Nitrosopumilus sp.]|uniref:DDE-type integrase/transposase/recombinase n=1 Tax=Nitrosopumilus sp. TaxID=2024843 RepID=UPI0034A03663